MPSSSLVIHEVFMVEVMIDFTSKLLLYGITSCG